MMKYLLTLVLILLGMSLYAQPNLDSLYSVWQDPANPDSTRVNAYKDYIWKGFIFSQPDSAFILAEALVAYGQENQYPKAEAQAYNTQGVSHIIQGDYIKALDFNQRSLKIYEEIGNRHGIANSLSNIGIVYDYQGDYIKALDYFQRSLKIEEELGNKEGIAGSLGNIGVKYKYQGNFPKALDYFHRSLKIFEEIGNKYGIANSLTNIGLIYHEQGEPSKALDYHQRSLNTYEAIGDINGTATSLNNIGNMYKSQGEYPKALDYYQRGLKLFEDIGNTTEIGVLLNNIGGIYDEQGKTSKALDYYQNSLKIREELGDKYGITYSLTAIGNLKKEQGRSNEAITECKKALALSQEIEAIEREKEACTCLYDTYKAMGKAKEALMYFEQEVQLNDSLNVTETAKKLQRMEFDKELLADSLRQEEEKHGIQLAHQSEVAEKDKTRNMLIGGGLLLLLAAIGLFSRNRHVNRSKKKIQKEKDRSEELLLNILPEEVAEELKQKGEAEAQMIDQVTVLFTDFKGFTAMSEQLSPKELVNDLNTCFSEFDRITAKYGIEKIKTIGDAYMAAGGLPTPNSTHATDVIKAAFEMRDFVAQGKAKKIEAGLPYFEIRIGVHTGPVVAGIVGVKKFQYDIWGDTVNTASRMESSGEVGQVNISEATYELVKESSEFDFTSRGKVEAKGKGEIEMYFVSNCN